MSISRPRYQLGGIPATKWMTMPRAIRIGSLFLAAIVMLILASSTQLWPLFLGALVLALGGCVSYLAGGSLLEDLTAPVRDRARQVFARWGRWDEYDPEFDERPFFVDDYSVLAVTSQEDEDAEGLCLIDTGHQNAYVTVLEVDGDGNGVRSDAEHARLERSFHQFINKLCGKSTCVSQIDLITRVSPENGTPFVEWTREHISEDASEEARRSAFQLAEGGDLLSSQIRSWAVLVLSMDQLAGYVRDRGLTPTPELLAEAAAEVTSSATRMMIDHGIRIHQGLTPRQVSAVIRAIMLPDYSVEDLTGLEDFWAGWAGFQPSSRRDSLVTYPPDRGAAWFHRSAVIPRDGLPTDMLVKGRWLEGVVLESTVPHRIISTKFLLIPHAEARDIAKDRLTTSQTSWFRQHRTGTVSDGETEEEVGLSQRVATDIRRRRKSGVIPIVRVMVSAQSERLVSRMAETIESELEQEMGVSEVTWDVPTLGMLATLPIGTAVRRK